MIPTQHYYCKRSREERKKIFKAFANKQKIDLLNIFWFERNGYKNFFMS